MAIDFPNSPSTNDTYTVGNKTWIYDGTTWNTYNSTSFSAETLPGTTIKSTVTGSSLTSTGTLTSLAVTGDVTVDTTTLKVDSTNNRVGIGTSSPSTALQVVGTVTATNFTGSPLDGTTSTAASGVGYMGLPQNVATIGSYTIVAADAGKHIYSTANRIVTIPGNTTGASPVAFPIGTTITFANATGATVTIAITNDTLLLVSSGTTGSRSLAPFGMATAVKVAATTWMISGNGLT
jgi:hypothetical protein